MAKSKSSGATNTIIGITVLVLFVGAFFMVGNPFKTPQSVFLSPEGELGSSRVYDFSPEVGLITTDLSQSAITQAIYTRPDYKPGESVQFTFTAEGLPAGKAYKVNTALTDSKGVGKFSNSYLVGSVSKTSTTLKGGVTFPAPSTRGVYTLTYKILDSNGKVIKTESKQINVIGGAGDTQQSTIQITSAQKAQTVASVIPATSSLSTRYSSQTQAYIKSQPACDTTCTTKTLYNSDSAFPAQFKNVAYAQATVCNKVVGTACVPSVTPTKIWCNPGSHFTSGSQISGDPALSPTGCTDLSIPATAPTVPKCGGDQNTVLAYDVAQNKYVPTCHCTIPTWVIVGGKCMSEEALRVTQTPTVKVVAPDTSSLGSLWLSIFKPRENVIEGMVDGSLIKQPATPSDTAKVVMKEFSDAPKVEDTCPETKDYCEITTSNPQPELMGTMIIETCYSYTQGTKPCEPTTKEATKYLNCSAGYHVPGTLSSLTPWDEKTQPCVKGASAKVSPDTSAPDVSVEKQPAGIDCSVSSNLLKTECLDYYCKKYPSKCNVEDCPKGTHLGSDGKCAQDVVTPLCVENPSAPECLPTIPKLVCKSYQKNVEGQCVMDLTKTFSQYGMYIIGGVVLFMMAAFAFMMNQNPPRGSSGGGSSSTASTSGYTPIGGGLK